MACLSRRPYRACLLLVAQDASVADVRGSSALRAALRGHPRLPPRRRHHRRVKSGRLDSHSQSCCLPRVATPPRSSDGGSQQRAAHRGSCACSRLWLAPAAGTTVAVLGAGPIGIVCLLAAKAFGASKARACGGWGSRTAAALCSAAALASRQHWSPFCWQVACGAFPFLS